MLDRTLAAMVDATAEPVPQVGTRTLCQYPGCGKPIELIPPAGPPDPVVHPVWAHLLLGTWVGPDHEATPVEPEHPAEHPAEHPGEQLIGRVQDTVRLYQRCRAETLADFAAYLRKKAGSGVDETAVALRWAAREAERRAGGES